jgi:hypothetical protein
MPGRPPFGRSGVESMRGLYLDTNVYIDWADGQQMCLLRRLRRAGSPVFLSPTTLFELLEDYWEAKTDREINRLRRALKFVAAHGAQRILPTQGLTLLRALGLPAKPQRNVRPAALERYLRFAIGLSNSQQDRGHDGRVRFDKQAMLQQLADAREVYIAGFETLRKEMIKAFAPTGSNFLASDDVQKFRQYLTTPEWSNVYVSANLRNFGVVDVTPEMIARAKRVLAASFAFDTVVLDGVIVSNYNLRKRRGDMFDSNQLAHLAEDGLVFVTSDRRLVERVKHTSQGFRVQTPSSWSPKYRA